MTTPKTTIEEKLKDQKRYFVHGHIFQWTLVDGEMTNEHVKEKSFVVYVPRSERHTEMAQAIYKVKEKFTDKSNFLPISVSQEKLSVFQKRPERV